MMTEDTIRMLEEELPSEPLKKLLERCLDLVNRSRRCMCQRYDVWDDANNTYLGRVAEDAEDKKAKEKKEPTKMEVPLTFAQIQSYASFLFLLFLQNRTFFELRGSGGEDYECDAEDVIERDLRHNAWPVLLYQTLIDLPRFGICVLDVGWKEDYVYVPRSLSVPPTTFMGREIDKPKVTYETSRMLKYKGNEVRVISPYAFFPDHRLPLRDLQKGEFVAYDDEMSDMALERLKDNKEVAGIKWIKPVTQVYLNDTKIKVRFNSVVPEGLDARKATHEIKLITKVQIDIVPKNVELGKDEFPIRYLVWIANNQRIIRLEPMGYLHCQFTTHVGEFSPDQHTPIGTGLAETIEYLQYTNTWLINSHIASIRRTIDSRFIYDPAGIDVKSLEARSPYIALRKNVSRSGVDRWIKQFQTVDATGGHMSDADGVYKIIQLVTGINDNAQGQYNSGRRSATESRAVTAGAASRLRTYGSVAWWQCYGPMGLQMLSNSRQGMDEKLWTRVFGMMPQDRRDAERYMQRYQLFKGDPETIAQMDDYLVYDATLPSEKGFIAQSMQELIQVAMANPETAMALNLNWERMIEKVYQLRGVDNIEYFRNTPQEQMLQYERYRVLSGAGTSNGAGQGNGSDQTNTGKRVLSK